MHLYWFPRFCSSISVGIPTFQIYSRCFLTLPHDCVLFAKEETFHLSINTSWTNERFLLWQFTINFVSKVCVDVIQQVTLQVSFVPRDLSDHVYTHFRNKVDCDLQRRTPFICPLNGHGCVEGKDWENFQTLVRHYAGKKH